MRVSFDIDNMTMVPFVPQTEKEGKGWSYSYVYYLRNLKDIYLLLCKYPDTPNISKLLLLCKSDNVQTENGKEWNLRYLLEFVNALKNFGLIDSSSIPLKGTLFESEINAPNMYYGQPAPKNTCPSQKKKKKNHIPQCPFRWSYFPADPYQQQELSFRALRDTPPG